jgi:hypothetical protein
MLLQGTEGIVELRAAVAFLKEWIERVECQFLPAESEIQPVSCRSHRTT